MSKIDFVIYWVDGNDPDWLNKKNSYLIRESSNISNYEARYRDWGNLETWIKSVYKFAPWVNKIFIITDNQEQEYFSKYDKVVSIDHTDYIPSEFLPTFNSHTIELNIHRINDLSEQFVVFNDDVFLIKPTKPTDFFVDSKPMDIYAFNVVSGIGNDEIIQSITLNDVSLINKHFNKRQQFKSNIGKWLNIKNGPENIRTLLLLPWPTFTGFFEPHICNSYLKSTFEKVWEKENKVLSNSSMNKFRDAKDVNQWVFRYWQLASGKSVNRNFKFGKMFTVTDESEKDCISWILARKSKVICINDYGTISNFSSTKENINAALIKNMERSS